MILTLRIKKALKAEYAVKCSRPGEHKTYVLQALICCSSSLFKTEEIKTQACQKWEEKRVKITATK